MNGPRKGKIEDDNIVDSKDALPQEIAQNDVSQTDVPPQVDASIQPEVSEKLVSEAMPEMPQEPVKVAPAETLAPQQEVAPPQVSAPKEPTLATPSQQIAQTDVHPYPTADKATAGDLDMANDITAGKVSPKTYSDLYAEKSTLGKIGTLFGLLVSGAGAGLSHQSNALLDMMNNQINKDLDSQKQSQANKLNWYNASLAHQKNNADIAEVNARSQAQRIGNYSNTLDAENKAWAQKYQPGFRDNSASAQAKNAMMVAGMIQEPQNYVNKMPPGPTKDQAQATIDNVIKPYVTNQAVRNNQEAQKKNDLMHAIKPSPLAKAATEPPSGLRAPAIDENAYKTGLQLGRLSSINPNVRLDPRAISPEDDQKIKDERKAVETNRQAAADYVDAFQKLQNLNNAGQIPGAQTAIAGLTGIGGAIGSGAGPLGAAVGAGIGNALGHGARDAADVFQQERNTQIKALKDRIGAALPGGLSDEAKEQLINSIMPSWSDKDEKQRAEKFRTGLQHFQSFDEPLGSTMKRYNLKTPFMAPRYMPTPQIAAPEATKEPSNFWIFGK